MKVMKEFWGVIQRLRASALEVHQRYLRLMFMVNWLVFQEPMQIFEAAGWDCDNALGQAYVRSMFGRTTEEDRNRGVSPPVWKPRSQGDGLC